jgi:hypothetical protein
MRCPPQCAVEPNLLSEYQGVPPPASAGCGTCFVRALMEAVEGSTPSGTSDAFSACTSFDPFPVSIIQDLCQNGGGTGKFIQAVDACMATVGCNWSVPTEASTPVTCAPANGGDCQTCNCGSGVASFLCSGSDTPVTDGLATVCTAGSPVSAYTQYCCQ